MNKEVWRQCGKKKRYKDESDARAVLRKCKERRGVDLDYYYCVYCKGYHLTHHLEALMTFGDDTKTRRSNSNRKNGKRNR